MRKLTTVLTAFALILMGCGDDNDVDAGSGSGGETTEEAPVQLAGDVANHGTQDAADGATLETEMDNFYFAPTFVKTTPGATVTIALHNESSADHTFTIDTLGIDEEVAAGETAEIDVTLPANGATAFYCRFHLDSDGMQGAFFFNEGDAVTGAAPTDIPGY